MGNSPSTNSVMKIGKTVKSNVATLHFLATLWRGWVGCTGVLHDIPSAKAPWNSPPVQWSMNMVPSVCPSEPESHVIQKALHWQKWYSSSLVINTTHSNHANDFETNKFGLQFCGWPGLGSFCGYPKNLFMFVGRLAFCRINKQGFISSKFQTWAKSSL